MADLIKFMIDNFKSFSKEIQNELLQTHFNRAARKRYYKTGILKQF